jgi:hypothetical protein
MFRVRFCGIYRADFGASWRIIGADAFLALVWVNQIRIGPFVNSLIWTLQLARATLGAILGNHVRHLQSLLLDHLAALWFSEDLSLACVIVDDFAGRQAKR